MSEVAPVSRSSEIESFLDTLYEGQEGYVYTPTKNNKTGYWQPYFFSWPKQKTAIVTHILDATKSKDCYIAPALFKAPDASKSAVKGTNYVWIEFDGNAPESEILRGIPEPTIRIRSSTKGHEHWYWRLDNFESEISVVEGLSKRLTYTLDADKSGWDACQVLRPPGTIHHDSKRRVTLLVSKTGTVKFSDFKNLVDPPVAAVVDTNFDHLPDVQDVVAKYKWPEDARELFKKPSQPVGSRSSAMTRLGFHCIEMGMTNEECYAILLNADDRWGKFKNRSPEDRAKRLIGIITHCRGKKAVSNELNLSESETFVKLGDFLNTKLEVKWVYKDFITEQGLGTISAQPGVGKTTLSIRLGMSVILKKDFLVWKSEIKDQKKVGFLSLEMASIECMKFINDMWPSFTPAEQEIIKENFFILPIGYSIPLGSEEYQQKILEQVDQHSIDFLIIDSLKAATGLDERRLEKFYEWVNKTLRGDRGITVWIVHHNRKPPNDGQPRKPRGLDDLYGDTFIGAHPSAVISLWKNGRGTLEVIPLKIRLAAEVGAFYLKRAPHLNFEVAGNVKLGDEDIESKEVDEDDSGETTSKSNPKPFS